MQREGRVRRRYLRKDSEGLEGVRGEETEEVGGVWGKEMEEGEVAEERIEE